MSLFTELTQEKKFTADLLLKFQNQYGDLFFRALKLLQDQGTKIKRTRFLPSKLEMWTIDGQSGVYLIYPELYCSCTNFLIETIYRKREYYPCKHLFAHKLAVCVGQFQSEELPDADYQSWIKDLL